MHKLYKSKSSKTKLTDLHFANDKNESVSKLCQNYGCYKVCVLFLLERNLKFPTPPSPKKQSQSVSFNGKLMFIE